MQKKKIVTLKGLPGSGKSFFVKEELRKGKRNVRINRDDMRAALFNDICLDQREEVITAAIDAMVDTLLQSPKVDIIYNDNTNLSERAMADWKAKSEKYNTQYEVVDFTHVPISTCIERDSKREKRVGRAVIERMAAQAGLLDFPKEKYAIVDCDGSYCSTEARQHFVATPGNKNWPAFFENLVHDEVRWDVHEIVESYRNQGVGIILLSGRPDTYGVITEDWFTQKGIEYDHIFLRKAKDSRDDTIIKSEILNRLLPKNKIVAVVDDRPKVLRQWATDFAGQNVVIHDVGDGIEF